MCAIFFTVFQQKAARRQSDGDKFHGPRKQGTNTNVSLFNSVQGGVKEGLWTLSKVSWDRSK